MDKNKQKKKKERERRVAQKKLAVQNRAQETKSTEPAKTLLKTTSLSGSIAIPKTDLRTTTQRTFSHQRRGGR